MKTKLKRFAAMLLCIATLLSMLAEGFAAGGQQGSAGEPSLVAETTERKDPSELRDATDPDTGKPRLYVDFLGDNAGHNKYTGAGNGVAGNSLTGVPGSAANSDQSKEIKTAANGSDPAVMWWERYTDPADLTATPAPPTYWDDANGNGVLETGEQRTIFNVGIGIDRMNLLKMLKQDNDGLYHFEAGFYYNPYFVEPYVGTPADATAEAVDASYADVLRSINLQGGALANAAANTYWNSTNYNVLEAHTNLEPQFDGGLKSDGTWGELTQEVITEHTNNYMRNPDNGWKMTYVSIEMTEAGLAAALANTANAARLDGVYDGEFHADDGTDDNHGTEYLLIIPFVLKRYDPAQELCFRLIRNATHLSIGSAPEGYESRTAWERVTTRNSDYNLKLQTVFTGDLNIWTGAKASDIENRYKARLVLDTGGALENEAKVSITSDPAMFGAYMDEDGQELTGLAGGVGLTIYTKCAPMYTVTVNVYLATDDKNKTPLITLEEVNGDALNRIRNWEFIMPEANVVVEIIFALDEGAPKDFSVLLDEYNRLGNDVTTDDSPIDVPDVDTPEIIGNKTTITGWQSPREKDDTFTAAELLAGRMNTTNSEVPDDRRLNYKGKRLPYITATAYEPPDWMGDEAYVTVRTELHGDYYAEVHLYTIDNVHFAPSDRPDESDLLTVPIKDADDNVIGTDFVLILHRSGTYKFAMRAASVIVDIKYLLAEQYTAELELHHYEVERIVDENDGSVTENIVKAPVNELNRAQLSFNGYRDDNHTERRYGSVYRDKYDGADPDKLTVPRVQTVDGDGVVTVTEPGVVKVAEIPNNYRIRPITTSAAAQSGSVSGDAPGPESFETLMKQAALCTPADTGASTPADYTPVTSNINAGDVIAMGLRSRQDGAFFTDAEMNTLAQRLNELTLKLTDYLAVQEEIIDNEGGAGPHTADEITDAMAAQSIVSAYLADGSYTKLDDDGVTEITYKYIKADCIDIVQAYLFAANLTERTAFFDRITTTEYDTLAAWADNYLYGPPAAFNSGIAEVTAALTAALTAYLAEQQAVIDDVSSTDQQKTDAAAAKKRILAYLTDTAPYSIDPECVDIMQAYQLSNAAGREALIQYIKDHDRDETIKYARYYLFRQSTTFTEADPVPARFGVALTGGATGGGGWTQRDVTDDKIKAREGREMRVAVETSSKYVVDKVVVKHPTDSTKDFEATKAAGYTNIYTFDMPAWNAVVEVYYKLRTAPKLNLQITPDTVSGNDVSMTAHIGQDDSVYTTTETKSTTGPKVTIEHALAGSIVTVDLTQINANYTVSVNVYDEDANLITTTVVGGGNVEQGAKLTFTMPNKETTINVQLTEKDRPLHTARIQAKPLTADLNIDAARAYFSDNNLPVKSGVEGMELPGIVRVPEGYYIHSVTALGPSGSHPFTQSGNGWANGRTGSVDINIDSAMPDEDITITAILALGPPPEDPRLGVTLLVNDPDNDGGAGETKTYADNWAQMDIPSIVGQTDPPPGTRYKVVDYPTTADGYAKADTEYVVSGTRIYVEVHPTGSYYVDAAVVTPSYHAINVVWTDATHFYFDTPSEACAVTVKYLDNEKHPEQSRDLFVQKTENNTADENNKLTALLIGGVAPNDGADPTPQPLEIKYGKHYAAKARQSVAATVQVAAGWHVRSIRLIEGGVTRYLTVPTLAYSDSTHQTMTLPVFYMPAANAQLYVDYRKGAPSDDIFDLRMVVEDNENKEEYDHDGDDATPKVYYDNWAKALIDHIVAPAGTPAYPLDPNDPNNLRELLGAFGHGATGHNVMAGLTTARSGDHVTIEWETQQTPNPEEKDFVLDVIAVTTDGRVIAPRYVYTPETPAVPEVPAVPATGTPGDPDYDPGTPGSPAIPAVPAKTTAHFDMPAADTTIYVRFVKGEERLYKADIVLYGVDGNAGNRASFEQTLDDAPTLGTDVYNRSGLHGGEYMPVYIEAADGYYIKEVTVTPRATGVPVTVGGAFGRQFASFNMPANDVQVNVKFEKAWPDEAGNKVTLTVIDPTADNDNYAHWRAGTPLVYGGESKVVRELTDGATGYIHTHRDTNAHIESVRVVDVAGDEHAWRWSSRYPNTIEFDMPPLAVEVIVEYAPGAPTPYNATLVVTHVTGTDGPNGTAVLSKTAEYDPDAVTENDKPTADLTAKAEWDRTNMKPLTSGPSTNGNKVTNAGIVSTEAGGVYTAAELLPGELMLLTVTPDEGSVIASAYAVSGSRIIDLFSLRQGAIPLAGLVGEMVDDGAGGTTLQSGSATFVVPKGDVTVYVEFAKKPTRDIDKFATLYVSGPANSGTATLYSRWDEAGTTTGAVSPVGSGYIILGEGSRARVKIQPNFTGVAGHKYVLGSIRVLAADGSVVTYKTLEQSPGVYVDADGLMTIEYVQPLGGSRVYVEFEEVEDRPYSVRVVVDNAGETGNKAGASLTDADWKKLLSNVEPGKQVNLNIECVTGYEFSVTVLPQSRGIIAPLSLANNKSQKTGFVMPPDDVVVYVKFIGDTRTRYTASLMVTGGGSGCFAEISSDYTAWQTARSGGNVAVVRAAAEPEQETVRVNTHKTDNEGNNYYLESITVETTAGAPVSYTMDANGNLSFPMVKSNVIVTLKYRLDSAPDYKLTLHVSNRSDVANGLAQLKERCSSPENKTDNIGVVVGTDSIRVQAGKIVDLSAVTTSSGAMSGIFDVYVRYGAGTPYAGQFVLFDHYVPTTDNTLAPPADAVVKSLLADFVMQPYDLDVYVVFAETDDDPPTATALWVEVIGPKNDDGTWDMGAGWAEFVTDRSGDTPIHVDVGEEKHSAASPDSYVGITMTANPGYVIDSILITPLYTDADPQRLGSVYALTMPNYSIKVTITLKKSETNDFIATLHVNNFAAVGNTITSPNRAEIYYKDSSENDHITDGFSHTEPWFNPHLPGNVPVEANQIVVPERQMVDMFAYLNEPGYYLLSAYVLDANGQMVDIIYGPGGAMEGTAYTGTAPTIPDASAQFSMPASDVDVYFVYTNLPTPPTGWRTTALVATEMSASGDVLNLGRNIAGISETVPNTFIYEITYAVDESGATPKEVVTLEELDLTDSDLVEGFVPSKGNPWHKAYITMPYVSVVVREVVTDPDCAFLPPVQMSATGVNIPNTVLLGDKPYRYRYETTVDSTSALMRYIEGSASAGDLKVTIIDNQNPGDLTVENSVKAEVTGKTPLKVVSSDSAGAWQVMPSVEPASNIKLTVTPYDGYVATAILKSGPTYNITTPIELTRTPTGYTAEVVMPSGSAEIEVTFVRGYYAELHVINHSSAAGATATLISPDGRTAGNNGRIVGLLGSELMRISTAGATVKSIVYTGGGVSAHAVKPQNENFWRFDMPAADTVVTVILADDDSTEHTALLRVDTRNSTAGWQDNCSLGGIVNDTRPSALGGDNWVSTVEGDSVTGTFTAGSGWYAVAYAIVRDADSTIGELGHPVYVVQSGNTGECYAGLTAPDENVEILVRFTTTPPPTPTDDDKYDLKLVLEDPLGRAANTATVTGADDPLSVTGAVNVSATTHVLPGAPITVTANWQDDNYRLIGAELEVTFTASGAGANPGWNLTHTLNIPLAPANPGDRTATKTFNAPMLNPSVTGVTPASGMTATIKVKLKYGYDITLELHDRTAAHNASAALDASDLLPTAKTISVPNGGSMSKTEGGFAKVTATQTTVATGGTVSVVGYNAATGSTVVPSTGGSYNYETNGDSVVNVITSDGGADRSYVAAVSLIGAQAGEWAYIENVTTPSLPFGEIWTAAKQSDSLLLEVLVGEGRSASVTANVAGVNTQLVPHGINADGRYTFTMPASDVQITVRYFSDDTAPLIKLGVIDRTGAAGKSTAGNKVQLTASKPAASTQIDTFTTNGGVVNGIVGTYAGDFGNITVAATPLADSTIIVKRIFVEGANGGLVELTNLTDKTFAQNRFSGGATVWVVFDHVTGPTPPNPVEDPYITYIEVDPTSVSGWAAAGNSVGRVLNTTNSTAAGGEHWRAGEPDDNMRGLFETAEGWYAEVHAYRMNTNGTVGAEIPAMVQNFQGSDSLGGGTASITQPSSDVKIVVKFTQTPPTATSKLTLAIAGHEQQLDNFARIQLDAITKKITGQDAPDADVYSELVKDGVAAGTKIPLDAGWGTKYTIKKIEVSFTNEAGGVYSVPWNEYGSTAAANLYMTSKDTTVTVYFALQYTATLHLHNEAGVSGGGASMYDDDNDAIKVNTDGGKLENLAGGEDIVTETTLPTGGRLVGVVYETALGGARSATATTPNERYDFDMPEADTDVYVLYEKEDGTNQIAKVVTTGATSVANNATIKNVSRTDAFGTQHFVMAHGGDRIEITVSLVEGYQAKVTSAIRDDTGATIYVTRTLFRSNGEVTAFDMPAGSDATVTIEFIEGYSAWLILSDQTTGDVNNFARMTDGTLPATFGGVNGQTNIEAAALGTADTEYHRHINTDPMETGTVSAPVNFIEKLGITAEIDGHTVTAPTSKFFRLLETTVTGGTYNVGDGRLALDAGEPASGGGALPSSGAAAETTNWMLGALGAGNPVEDVWITAIVVDADYDPLIAKVQLEGASDINGNTATILNTETAATGHPWMTGSIWTTANEENSIKTTVGLAPGYTATVIAISDKLYKEKLDEIAADVTAGTITQEDAAKQAREHAMLLLDDQTVPGQVVVAENGTEITVIMPDCSDKTTHTHNDGTNQKLDRSDITVIVIYAQVAGPRPYDPDSYKYSYLPAGKTAEEDKIDVLERGWIYGVNHGDYATITVPTLNTGDPHRPDGETEDQEILQDVYRADEDGRPGFSNDFKIYVKIDGGGFVELSTTTEIRLYEAAPLPDGQTYPYNVIEKAYVGAGEFSVDPQDGNGQIFDDKDATEYPTGYEYTGVRFNIELRDVEEKNQSAAYKAFKEILEKGSYDTEIGTKLEIRAVGNNGSISEATPLVLPPTYAIEGTLISYAPQHEATFSLYKWDAGADYGNGAYETTVDTVNHLKQDYGSGLWWQTFRVRSSELAGRNRSTVAKDLDVLFGVTGAKGYTGSATYRLVVEKPSAVTYQRDGLLLKITDGKASDADLLGADGRSWILARESSAGAAASPSGMVLEAVDAYTLPVSVNTAAEPVDIPTAGPADAQCDADDPLVEPGDVSAPAEPADESINTADAPAAPADTETDPTAVEDEPVAAELAECVVAEINAESAEDDIVDGTATEPAEDDTIDATTEPENDTVDTTAAPVENEAGIADTTAELGEFADTTPEYADNTAEPTDDAENEPAAEPEIAAEQVSFALAPYAAGTPAIVRDAIVLITGDVDGDDRVKGSDYDLLYAYFAYQFKWTTSQSNADSWDMSVYNPESYAYRCDLNGDGSIDQLDVSIFYDIYNFNATQARYGLQTLLTRRWDDAYDEMLDDYLTYAGLKGMAMDGVSFNVVEPMLGMSVETIGAEEAIEPTDDGAIEPAGTENLPDPTEPIAPAEPADIEDMIAPTDQTDPIDPTDPTDTTVDSTDTSTESSAPTDVPADVADPITDTPEAVPTGADVDEPDIDRADDTVEADADGPVDSADTPDAAPSDMSPAEPDAAPVTDAAKAAAPDAAPPDDRKVGEEPPGGPLKDLSLSAE